MKFFLLFLLALQPLVFFGQEDSCDCCSYSSLQYKEDYDKVFDPIIIKEKGIKEVMIYTSPKIKNNSIVSNKYREIKFKFDNNGLVKSQTIYNRNGIPHSIYHLKRNSTGKIYQIVFNYLDSLERKSNFSIPEITDFKYDSKNRIVKVKERYNGKVIPDYKARYTIIKYDEMDRIFKIINHRVHNDTSSVSERNYNYSDDNLNATYESKRDTILSLSGKESYNKKGDKIFDKSYNEILKKEAFQNHYEYDSVGRLIKEDSKNGQGGGSECPDGGTYCNCYFYNKEGLLIKINHEYDKTVCEMTFEYKE